MLANLTYIYCLLYYMYDKLRVEPPNKGQVGVKINSDTSVLCREVVLSEVQNALQLSNMYIRMYRIFMTQTKSCNTGEKWLHIQRTLNKGHFGDNINSADLFFVERLSSLGGSECIVGIILGP